MQIETTPIKDLLILTPRIFTDDRGYFFESFNNEVFKKNNLHYHFIQDNQSYSSYATLRGLHFQKGEYAQAKLVRAVVGQVLDVVVDLREDSPTFGKSFSIILDDQSQKQLLIPRGFAHGFVVLSTNAMFSYKVDNFYNKESEAGIIFNDNALAIDWMIPERDIILSDKDKKLGSFHDLYPRA